NLRGQGGGRDGAKYPCRRRQGWSAHPQRSADRARTACHGRGRGRDPARALPCRGRSDPFCRPDGPCCAGAGREGAGGWRMTPEALGRLAALTEARRDRDLARLEALMVEDRGLAEEIMRLAAVPAQDM